MAVNAVRNAENHWALLRDRGARILINRRDWRRYAERYFDCRRAVLVIIHFHSIDRISEKISGLQAWAVIFRNVKCSDQILPLWQRVAFKEIVWPSGVISVWTTVLEHEIHRQIRWACRFVHELQF